MGTVQLSTAVFKEKVFDYTKSQEWAYQDNIPCIIDFYADWCGPCKAVAPILEELAAEYDGKIIIYKVDTEVEQELSAAFGIRSIPSILFFQQGREIARQAGAMSQGDIVRWARSHIKP